MHFCYFYGFNLLFAYYFQPAVNNNPYFATPIILDDFLSIKAF